MSKFLAFAFIMSFCGMVCGKEYNYPGQLEIKTFRIGQKVDTNLFVKVLDLYFPNYLDGWTMGNSTQLPEKYYGLPIAIWQLKSDSGIALTLLKNIVLNITVSYLTETEKQEFSVMAIEKFGGDGVLKSYEQTHPLQSWITYWDLNTWETKDVIFQLGQSDMRMPEDTTPKNQRWNLAYSDLSLEHNVISAYKKGIFSNKNDSVKYETDLNRYINRQHPPENGQYTDYFESSRLKERGNYKNGRKDGLWETWFENGQKEDSAIYVNDNLFGKRLMWFSNGQLQLESHWGKQDKRIGKWIRYYENGQIESITSFNKKGELHGKHLQYFENGKLKREVIYDCGKETEDILYDEHGNRLK